MSASKNIPPVRYDKFDIKKFSIEKPQGKEYTTNNQILSFPRYSSEQFNIQTPMIKIVSGGVPSINSAYHKTPKDRANGIKIPLDVNDPEVKKLYDSLKEIDQYLGSDEYKSTLPDHKKHKYEYLPLVREPTTDDSSDKKSYQYIKVKLDCKLNDDNVNIDSISTSVFQKNDSGKFEKLPVDSIDDFAKHVCYLGTARFVLSFNKFYILKASKKYGIALKIKQVEVNPIKSNAKFNYDEPTFDDDGDDDGDDDANKAKTSDNTTPSVHIKVADTTTHSDDDDDDDDDLDNKENNDDEAEEDDEDEDEEEIKAAVKSKPSKSKIMEQESEKQSKKGRKKAGA